MIPQNIKELFAQTSGVSLLQMLVTLFCIAFFLVFVFRVFQKPKNYYQEQQDAPLEQDEITKETQGKSTQG